jgi:uncharacterized membrane protein
MSGIGTADRSVPSAPTWSEIGQLAAIATARTALNFFLQQETDKAAARRSVVETKPSA